MNEGLREANRRKSNPSFQKYLGLKSDGKALYTYRYIHVLPRISGRNAIFQSQRAIRWRSQVALQWAMLDSHKETQRRIKRTEADAHFNDLD